MDRLPQINGIAGAQDGVITRRQLLDIGLSKSAVDRRMRSGLIARIHAGVYRVGPVCATYMAERAALLACGGGVISYQAAARVLGMQPTRGYPDVIDVTMPTSAHATRRPGIRVHRRKLMAYEFSTVEALPVTTVVRTLMDLASVPGADVGRLFTRAENRDPTIREKLLGLIDRHPHVAGSRSLRILLDDSTDSAFTRSEAEERLLSVITSARLPSPEVNVRVEGLEVDFYWRSARLIVEVDGYEFHGSKRAFLKDRQRDIALASNGYRVIRLTWHQLTKERDRTLVQLALALSRTGL